MAKNKLPSGVGGGAVLEVQKALQTIKLFSPVPSLHCCFLQVGPRV
jgi:hypothetical protein